MESQELGQKQYRCTLDFHSTAIGKWIVDRNGIIQDVNKAFLLQYNLNHTQITGRSVEDFLVKTDNAEYSEYKEHLEFFSGTGRPHPGHYTIILDLKERGLRTFIVTESGVESSLYEENEIEEPEKKVMRLIDISERVDREQHAYNSSHLKSRFLANMTHEIRTPLSAIMGFAELLLEESDISFESREKLNLIRKSSDILLELINDLLDFSKIEANKLEIIERNFSMKTLIDHVKSLFEYKMMRKGLSFQVNLSEDVPECIRGDENRIGQILINLLGNAWKFTEIGAVELVIDYEKENKRIIFRVADSGIGMEKEQLLRIFEAYNQSDKSIQRTYGGTGLGLAISRQLAQLMNGDLSVESEPALGSVFTLTLPALPAISVESRKINVLESGDKFDHVAELSGKKLAVLVVEDNEINQKLALHVLKQLLPSSSIDIRSNGYEALQVLGLKRYDIVFMDIHMPVMDGVTAARQWLKHPLYYELPIIVVSAEASEKTRKNLLASGLFADYLVKPFRRDQIGDVLYRQVLGRRFVPVLKKEKKESPVFLLQESLWGSQFSSCSL